MNSFSLWGFSFLPQFALGDVAQDYWSAPLALSNIAAFFVYCLGSAKLPRAFDRAPFVETVLLMSAGLIFLLGFLITETLALLSVSGVLLGIGTTCCFICWETVFSLSEAREAKKQIVLGSVLSLFPFGLFFAFGPSGLLFTVSLLALCNLALLFFALRFNDADVAARELPPRESPDGYRTVRRRFWKPLLCIVMIGIVSPVLGSAAFEGHLAFFESCAIVFSANLLSAAVLGFVWLALRKETTISSAYVVLFPVLITALLLFPFIDERYRAFVLLIGSFGFTLFSIVMMMSCVDIARKERLSLVFVYALFAGVTYASRLIGQGIAAIIEHSSLSQETQIVTSVFVLLYGCSIVMFVLVRKNASGERAASTRVAEGVDVLQQAVLQLAEERGLSQRQTEVLDLLSHGYDVPSIAKKLFISENTVRTHMKKIYTLLDVHSKQEIINLVNGRSIAKGAEGSE